MYFWITLVVKDFLLASAAVVMLTVIACGRYTSCECWTRWLSWDHVQYLSFPQEQFMYDRIKHRLKWEFSAIVGGCFAFELIFFGYVAWIFRSGHRVLKQRDLDTVVDRVAYPHNMKSFFSKLFMPGKTYFASEIERRRKVSAARQLTSEVESQPPIDADEDEVSRASPSRPTEVMAVKTAQTLIPQVPPHQTICQCGHSTDRPAMCVKEVLR